MKSKIASNIVLVIIIAGLTTLVFWSFLEFLDKGKKPEPKVEEIQDDYYVDPETKKNEIR